MALQPNPLSAMELIAQEPIRLVHGRKAICDGGGGPLGHPKIYINLDQPGPRACGCVYVSRHLGFWIEVAQYMPTRAPFAIDIVEFGSNKTPIIINSHPHMLPYETIERASPSDKCYDLNVKNTADHKIGFNPF
ncbi:unnamed protein product [Cyclocybe aegerita]|uniref:Zinc finger CHCC-type domain-containing protein n=1 Tax=Cyclocybe aegerita TaxID=1973307 RepID=A0A8S0WM64_CYCAE|nr:unnamed protein product [Cyclocybe aegerita]